MSSKEKPRLHYCETHYHLKPHVDINPLILELHKEQEILALCAREQMVTRINALIKKEPWHKVSAFGWWAIEWMSLMKDHELDKEELYAYDAVVIIGRARIDLLFLPLLTEVERALKCSHPPLIA